MTEAAATPAAKTAAALTPAPADTSPAVVNRGDRKAVPFSALHPSTLNPRKHFDGEALQTLAASIAAEGIMQNLTVRPHPKIKDAYELVAGERRYRAVEQLVKAGRAKADFPMPVLVQDIKDTEVITLAMAENMARNALTPMEEARGFAALRERGVPTLTIAKYIGVTPRMIQQRLALVDKASPEVQKALDAGDITVTHARTLILAPAKQQSKVLKRLVEDDDEWTEDQLREEVVGDLYETKGAIFDLKLYKGQIIEDEEAKTAYFEDGKQFEKLQREAVAAKVKALTPTVAWLKVCDKTKGEYFSSWDYSKKAGAKNAGIVIEIERDLGVKIHKDLVNNADAHRSAAATTASATSPAKAKPANPDDAFTGGHRVHAHIRKTHALQRALLADPLAAQRVLCATMILEDGFNPVNIRVVDSSLGYNARRGFKDVHDNLTAPEVNAALAKALEGCPGVKVGKLGFESADKKDEVKVWAWVAGLSPEKLSRLLTALVADQVGTWCDRAAYGEGLPMDDDESAYALADYLGLAGKEAKHGLTLTAEDLEGLRKPALLAVCCNLKIDDVTDTFTGDKLKGLIAAKLKANGDKTSFVLPTLAFSENNQDAVKGFIKLGTAHGAGAKPTAKAAAPKPAAKSTPKAKAKSKKKGK